MTTLALIADPANWQLMPMWTEGIRRDYPVWVGEPKILELARREMIADKEANNE
jgi:hypothetical protein